MPIFESLRQQEDLPCSYPLAMGSSKLPSYHWVNKHNCHHYCNAFCCVYNPLQHHGKMTCCLLCILFYFFMLIPSFESMTRITVQVGRTISYWNTLKFANHNTSLQFQVVFYKCHLVIMVKNHMLVLLSLPEEFKAYVM